MQDKNVHLVVPKFMGPFFFFPKVHQDQSSTSPRTCMEGNNHWSRNSRRCSRFVGWISISIPKSRCCSWWVSKMIFLVWDETHRNGWDEANGPPFCTKGFLRCRPSSRPAPTRWKSMKCERCACLEWVSWTFLDIFFVWFVVLERVFPRSLMLFATFWSFDARSIRPQQPAHASSSILATWPFWLQNQVGLEENNQEPAQDARFVWGASCYVIIFSAALRFSLLGDQNRTARLVRDILSRAYSPEGFAGDEDNGEMGSWYVLSAMGLYQPVSWAMNKMRPWELLVARNDMKDSSIWKTRFWHLKCPFHTSMCHLSSFGIWQIFESSSSASTGIIVLITLSTHWKWS